jgi:hypothetical protein
MIRTVLRRWAGGAWRARVGSALLAGLVSCSPGLDWRQTQVADGRLRAMFPCRPDHQGRQVVLAGRPVEMMLQACEAQGMVFAVSYLDAGAPSHVDAALQALQLAASTNMPALGARAEGIAQVPGMTPQPSSSQFVWRTRLSDGRVRRVAAIWASRGTLVIQATAMGSDQQAVEAAWQPFLEGLGFVP